MGHEPAGAVSQPPRSLCVALDSGQRLTARPEVFAARYESRHGDLGTRVFRTQALALARRDEIGRQNWNERRDGLRPDDNGGAGLQSSRHGGADPTAHAIDRLFEPAAFGGAN
jgi:hypothetical protein